MVPDDASGPPSDCVDGGSSGSPAIGVTLIGASGMAVESDFSVSSAETGVAATLGVEIVRASAGTMPSGTATAVASSIWVTFG